MLRNIVIRGADHELVLDWTYGYARYDRPRPDTMYRMSEGEYDHLRHLIQTILFSACNLVSVEVAGTDIPLTEDLVASINAHPSIRSITFQNFRQLHLLPVEFCSSTALTRVHFRGVQLLERALDIPLREGLLEACTREKSGPYIHELVTDYFTDFPARDLTFNGLECIHLDYPDQLYSSMSTGFFSRHERIHSVYFGFSIIKYGSTLIATSGCRLAALYSGALDRRLEKAFVLVDTHFALDPTLERDRAESWMIRSTNVVLKSDHRRALSYALDNLPVCEEMMISDRSEEEITMAAVSFSLRL